MHETNTLRDWADIRLFLAIHDQGSLVGASEALELTQPTVGRRLSAMEERFGTPLFARAGRRMQLTDAGAGILESARRMEREMIAIGLSLEAQSTALHGEVCISATEGTMNLGWRLEPSKQSRSMVSRMAGLAKRASSWST